MAVKDWTKAVAKDYISVDWPVHAGSQRVHEFLRQHFGDNDIHQAYTERRWIVIRGSQASLDKIYFRNEEDAIWFSLSWKLQ